MKKDVTNKQVLSACNFSGPGSKVLKAAQAFLRQTCLFFVFILLVLTSFSTNAQDHVFAWAKRMGAGGGNLDEGKGIATDAQGNVYTTGLFRGTADFGTISLTSASTNADDIFIQKLDADGNILWAKRIGSAGGDVGRAIATDASGNVYIAGLFNGTVDFGSGTGITSAGDADIFILKLTTNGDFVWAKTMGGSGGDDAKSITTDASGNVYVTGQFNGTVDFGSGTGITSAGGNDIFILKLDAGGNFGWVKTMGGSGSDIGFGITTDASGNIYTTGQFNGTVDFGSGTGITSAGGNDIFILKLGAGGNFGWAKTMGGSGGDIGYGITADESGNVYTTGQFNGTANFGATSLTSAGGNDIFIQKLDGAGNFVWAKSMGGTGSDIGYSITLDASGNVYTTGVFAGTADLNPGAETYNLIAIANNSDTFIQKLDAGGNFVWAKGIYDSLSGAGLGIAADASGNIHVAGSFGGASDFDPGEGSYDLTALGTSRDIFVLKWRQQEVTSVIFTSFTVTANGSRVNLSWQTSSERNNSHFEVEASRDGINYTKLGTVNSKATTGNSDSNLDYDFSFDAQNEGALLSVAVFSLAFIGLMFRRKNKWLFTLFVVVGLGIFGISSCSKKDPPVEKEPDNVVPGKQQIFVRIKQVNKDGGFKYSDVEIVQVEKK